MGSLVGLRGLMALNVTLRHLAQSGVVTGATAGAALAPFGFGLIGHDLFFILSGFGLTTTTLRHEADGRTAPLGAYLLRRWSRLAPPYYVALALYLLLASPPPAGSPPAAWPAWADLLAHLSMLHALWVETATTISPPLWSISTIFQFYLVFPLLYALMRRFDYRLVVAGAAIFWPAFRGVFHAATLGQGILLSGCVLGRPLLFALGMGVAFWADEARRGRARWVPARAAAAFGAGLLAVAVTWHNWGPVTGLDLFYGLGYSALLVATLTSAERGGRLGRVLALPAMGWLGAISYSLYLTHDLAFGWAYRAHRLLGLRPGLASDALLVAASLLLALAVARAFHRLVEVPLARTLGAPAARTAGKGEARAPRPARRPPVAAPTRGVPLGQTSSP